MGRFSLDRYQVMNPLWTEGFDISKTVETLNEAAKNASILADVKRPPAVVGVDTEVGDENFLKHSNPIDAIAASDLSSVDKENAIRKTAVAYANDPGNRDRGISFGQQQDYNAGLADRVKKADIKDDDANIGSQASLLLHNYTGGTNAQNGKFYAASQIAVPNLVDEQDMITKIKTPGSGYRNETQSYSFDPATGNIKTLNTVTGKEEWKKGDQVADILYNNNEKGIKDRHIWDSKKELASDLVTSGKFRTLPEAFLAVDHNVNGAFTNRLIDKVNEKKTRFVNNLVAQTNYKTTENSTENKLDLGPVGSGTSSQALDLVIDSKPDVHTTFITDDALNSIDLDQIVNGTIPENDPVYADFRGAWNMGMSSTSQDSSNAVYKAEYQKRHQELVKTITDLREGKADVVSRYGFNPEEWKKMPKSNQDLAIKGLILQRRNVSSNVGILEKDNNDVYATALENPAYYRVFQHSTKSWQEVDKKGFVTKYLDPSGVVDSLSEKDGEYFKATSGFEGSGGSEITSPDEFRQHTIASKITPELALDFSGNSVKAYFQYNFGPNNSAVQVPTSNITNASLAPLNTAFKEFKNPTGKEVPIASHIGLSSNGKYKEYSNLSAKWVNGTYTIMSNGKSIPGMTLEGLGFGIIGALSNKVNTTANVAQNKYTKQIK